MKNNMKIMGQLSVVLLICVLLGQGMWLYHVREMKLGEFRESANYALLNATYNYLSDECLNVGKNYKLTYSLTKDNRFYWRYDNKKDTIPIKSPDMVDKLEKLIIYDCLCEHGLFDVLRLNKLYIDYLKEKGIVESPVLKVLNVEGKELLSTGNLRNDCSSIITVPVDLGYKYQHQIIAIFELPFIFRALSGILWVELIFMIGFIFCLVWQWCSIRMTVRSARIQTMGMTHLEHELKKPLAAVTSALEGIVNRKNRELTAIQEEKLKMVEVRIRKMAETLGFGTATQLAPGLQGASGTLPDATALENPGELATFSFGQGALTVTPLQITAMMNTVANGGVYRTPAFVQGIVDAEGTLTGQTRAADTRTVFDAATARVLRSMLASVVSEGIGSEAQPKTGTAGGKTGTAQTGQYDENGEELLNYWFSGFYPADDPRYTITVLQDGILKPETSSAAIFAKVTEILAVWENS